MVIINNVRNTHIKVEAQAPTSTSPATWQQHLLHLLKQFIDEVPPKQLNRELRSYFMVHIAGLKAMPADYQNRILHIAAILELLDEAEDNNL
jgi:hypothetical protein